MNFLLKTITSIYPTLLWTLTILVLCSMPSEHIPLTESISDKVAHFAVFGFWSFLALWYKPNYLKVGILGITFGLLIECIQKSLPESFHRSFDWIDLVADSIGVILGLITFGIFTQIIRMKNINS